jgi:hypothetical protein
MSKRQSKKKTVSDPLIARLDALIALFVRMNDPKSKEKFNDAVATRILNSAGLTPTEIARILGKKSRTDIAQYLYPPKKSGTKGKKDENREDIEKTSRREEVLLNEPRKASDEKE